MPGLISVLSMRPVPSLSESHLNSPHIKNPKMPSLFSRSKSNNVSSLPLPPTAVLPTDPSEQFVETIVPPTASSSHGYGHLHLHPGLTISVDHLHTLVAIINKYLDVETAFVFSADAMDLDAPRVARLIAKFVDALKANDLTRFDDEARFAGSHELGMLLRWALARALRVDQSANKFSRGLIPYLAYLNWAKQEHVQNYPPTHFFSILQTRTKVSIPVPVPASPGGGVSEMGQLRPDGSTVVVREQLREVIPEPLKATLLTLFGLLARLVAHSAKSGITPPALSPLFGPLLFGLGPLDIPEHIIEDPASFNSIYTSYLRSVHATEHLLLSFIRWQDTPSTLGGGSVNGTNVPTRLKEWIRDYPRALSGHAKVLSLADSLGSSTQSMPDLGLRKGAKTIRVLSARRTVPTYDRDLVRSSARWALPSSQGMLADSREWGRICPLSSPADIKDSRGGAGERLPARYSESYRKKMNIPLGVEPGSSPYAPSLSSSTSSSSYSSYSVSLSPLTRSTSATSAYSYSEGSPGSSGPNTPTSPSTSQTSSRFKTLTDAQWGLFESSGFSSPSIAARGKTTRDINSALRFDLTESARKARIGQRERESVSWGDFMEAGFDRDMDQNAPLGLPSSTSSKGLVYGESYVKEGGKTRDRKGAPRAVGAGYVGLGADGKLTDVGDFVLDTGLDAALQFNLSDFGILGSTKMSAERGLTGNERERTLSAMGKRLKRKEKPLPTFTHSTAPILGSESLIEAAFLDVWVDLVSWGFAATVTGESLLEVLEGTGMLGFYADAKGTTLTLNRSISRDDTDLLDPAVAAETAQWKIDLFKECNWALVEFKALPNSSSPAPPSSHNTPTSDPRDPRIATSLLLFEEYVPREYRAQLGHQLAGINTELIMNPTRSSSTTAGPGSGSYGGGSMGRVRLGSLFSSPNSGNYGASTSSLGLVDSNRGKKGKKSKKDKKDKALPTAFFTGSTRTLTGSGAATPTPYDSRNGASSTPTPYSRARLQPNADLESPSTPTGPGAMRAPTRTNKFEEFDAILADGNRGTKVITLNSALREDGYTDNEEDAQYSAYSRTHEGGLPEGAMPPMDLHSPSSSSIGHSLPPLPPSVPSSKPPLTPITTSLSASTSSQLPASTPAGSSSTELSTSQPLESESKKSSSNLFRLTPSKPKGPKARRQSRQNLVPAEYSTVEFETRLTGPGSGGETEDETGEDRGGAEIGASGLGDDAFLEEAARRRKTARLTERDKLKSERRGGAKRFSLGLGRGNGGGNDDDDAWVDIVIPSKNPTTEGANDRRGVKGDPEEASQEVARVLNAVRGGQPYPLDDESDWEDPKGSPQQQRVGNGSSHFGAIPSEVYSDDIEVQTVPRKALVHPEGQYDIHNGDDQSYHEDESRDEDRSYIEQDDTEDALPKRRLGYFDLHPERRPGSITSQEILSKSGPSPSSGDEDYSGRKDEDEDDEEDDDDDPRARYATQSDEDDDAPRDLDKVYATRDQHQADKTARPLPTLPPAQNGSTLRTSSPSPASSLPTTKAIPISPAPATPPKPSSKTAALIEMYREKEKKSPTPSTLNSPSSSGILHPSKIPVASPTSTPAPNLASPPTSPAPAPSRIPLKTGLPTVPGSTAPSSISVPSLPTSPAAPVPAAKPLSKTSTVGINSQMDDDDESEELSPPAIALGVDAGRASPGRYIHGAPLHNVLEEEEEE
ncbi:hypothetical protein BDP27DRAFT_138567 [Rhodocollybia butyracea]|uniref:Rho-GAP domain-containing protein n=1 Tax=Rhodocollybia butyracea TaxID=206335 RepID=A0A9P5Q6L1_9AGAR|nr:hypothetical protein BDP27DRAFT_138567 [Rhodocollybia butyracea]